MQFVDGGGGVILPLLFRHLLEWLIGFEHGLFICVSSSIRHQVSLLQD